jgi:predicted nucleic acid-binding Zn ribbon protein
MTDAAGQINRLRTWRVREPRDTAIAPLIAQTAAEARRTRTRLGSLVDLWEALVPGDLAAHSRVTALRGGVAHVTASSSSVAYELDRRLREGLQQQMRRAFGRTLVRVKITVGKV